MNASDENAVSASLHFQLPTLPESWLGRWSEPPCSGKRVTSRRALNTAVDQEVIPRLLLAHHCPAPAVAGCQPSESLIDEAACELARLACAVDGPGARALAEDLLDQGIPLETFWLLVLRRAAQVIGIEWEEDRLDLFQVAAAAGCLQALLHETADSRSAEVPYASDARRILLVAVPGETHTFGSAMAAELFRRRSWDVDAESVSDLDELLDRVRSTHYHVVGLSICCDQRLPHLAEAVHRIRVHSRNRRVGVLVGGPPVADHPEWHHRIGADAVSQDALHGIALAEQLLGLLVQQA